MLDFSSPQAVAALVGGTVAAVTAVLTVIVTVSVAERKLRRDFRLDFAAEKAANNLLRTRWRLRSFDLIKVHLGGFSDDELRKILVRAGAVRFSSKSGIELWGLLDRTRDLLGLHRVPWDPENRPEEWDVVQKEQARQ